METKMRGRWYTTTQGGKRPPTVMLGTKHIQLQRADLEAMLASLARLEAETRDD